MRFYNREEELALLEKQGTIGPPVGNDNTCWPSSYRKNFVVA